MLQVPWIDRQPSPRQHQEFRRLLAFHRLTQDWRAELIKSSELWRLPRTHQKQDYAWLKTPTWEHASFSSPSLGALLDERDPSSTLDAMRRLAWAMQASLILQEGVMHESPRLEQVAFRHGLRCARSDWEKAENLDPRSLDLLTAALAFGPFGAFNESVNGFQRVYSSQREIDLLWRSCPHQADFSEIDPVRDLLCSLQSHSLHGYVYALSPETHFVHKRVHSARGIHCQIVIRTPLEMKP